MTTTDPETVKSPQQANSEGMRALSEARLDEAAAWFRRAVVLDASSSALWRNLATVHRRTGDDEAERAALDAALDCDRTDFMAWLRKAELHERLGENVEAAKAWSGVLQMAAHFDPVPEGLVDTLAHGRNYVEGHQAWLRQKVGAALDLDLARLDQTARRRVEAFVAHAGGTRQVYQNQCAGLYYPFLPADEFFDDYHFPWFAELAEQTDAIRAELKVLLEAPGEALRPYVRMDKGTPQNKWSGLDHSLDWGACFLWEYGVPNEPVLAQCPATRAALEAIPQAHIPGRAPNVFFSILRPRTHIPPHTGVTNTRAIIHLPLIVPEGCKFRVGGETRSWVEGQPFAFDDTIDHEAWNNSDALRAVLIFDVWNPHLSAAEQEMITRYYDASDKADLNPEKRSR